MSDQMSNLMKIFVQDEEETAPTPADAPAQPSSPDPLAGEPVHPAPALNGSHANPFQQPQVVPPIPETQPEPIFTETPVAPSPSPDSPPLSQSEIAAIELQRMILGISDGDDEQPEPTPVAAPPAEPIQPAPTPVPVPAAAESPNLDDYQSIHESLSVISRRLESLPLGNPSGEPLLRQIGPGGLNFVEQAMQVAETQAGILPRSFDLETFQKEGKELRDLGTLSAELKALTTRVENAEAAIGSDAFARALSVYQAAKLANATADLDRFLA
ncbi:MAG: hypothetical protein ACI8UO_002351 [Verrucomicrobiales bacterium]|jgi:hypothetical protein